MGLERPSPLVRTAETRVWWLTVEQGANLLRSATPLKHFDDYISGFRPARDEPSVQMEVAHQEVQPLNMSLWPRARTLAGRSAGGST